mgnify:CR=1 FL=1
MSQDLRDISGFGATELTDEIICPYCGYAEDDSYEYTDYHEYTCPNCDETSDLSVMVEINYSTYKRKNNENIHTD